MVEGDWDKDYKKFRSPGRPGPPQYGHNNEAAWEAGSTFSTASSSRFSDVSGNASGARQRHTAGGGGGGGYRDYQAAASSRDRDPQSPRGTYQFVHGASREREQRTDFLKRLALFLVRTVFP